MTPVELAAECLRAIARQAELRAEHGDLSWPPAAIRLVLKRKTPHLRDTIRLFGRGGGPLGEVLAEPADGEVLAVFDADAVLRWLTSRGVVNVRVADGGTTVEITQLADRELPA